MCEDLRLSSQAAKGARVHNAATVALECGAVGVRWFDVRARRKRIACRTRYRAKCEGVFRHAHVAVVLFLRGCIAAHFHFGELGQTHLGALQLLFHLARLAGVGVARSGVRIFG